MTPPAVYNGKAFRFTWTYRTAAGKELGIVARYDDGQGGKEIIPFFGPNSKPAAPPEPRPLFGLDSLRNPQAPVYIVEGEKCAACLHNLGLQAVTSLGGANAPHKSDWTPLEDFKTIYIFPDNDAPGEVYARDVAGVLASLPGQRSVLIARLPGLPDHGDVVDWAQARISDWDGFESIPREVAGDLMSSLVECVKENAQPIPQEWAAPAVEAAEAWEPPVPLDAATVPPWPRDVFPPVVQAFVDALAAATETPPELPAMMILAVLATAAHGKYRVRVKQNYFEPVNLWTSCALPPATRKTAVYQAAIKPVAEWERELQARAEPEIARAESERKTIQARIDALRAKAAKEKDAQKFDILKAEISELEAALPEVPRSPQIWTQDVTPENLAVIMRENGECMALLCDEGGMFDTMAGRYSNGVPNLDIYLHGHAGSDVRVNRGSRPQLKLESACLTVGICPQPDVIRALQDKPGFRGRGLLGRFLYAMPESNLGRRTLDPLPMPDSVRESYIANVKAMFSHPYSEDTEGRPCAHELKLSPEAFDASLVFARTVEAGIGDGGTFSHMTDWAGKLPGAVARIAAVLHVARYAFDEPWQFPVGIDDMAAAVRLGNVLSQHALIAFDAMGADAALENARAALAWINRKRLDTFSVRDCQYAHKARLPKKTNVIEALDILEERHFIRRRTPEPGKPGRPSEVYHVNPMAIKGG